MFHSWRAPNARFRLLARLREHARAPASHSWAVLMSIRRLLISCLISTTLVRISTKRFPVRLTLCHSWYHEVHSNISVEAVKILCVPVQECNDVEDELGQSLGACWWVGLNHENKIGFKRGSPLNGGDLFAHKSKPIAKSASQRYVTKKREIFWALSSGTSGKKMNRLYIRETGTQINTIRGWGLMLVLPPSMLDQPFRSTAQMLGTEFVGRIMGLLMEERDGSLRE